MDKHITNDIRPKGLNLSSGKNPPSSMNEKIIKRLRFKRKQLLSAEEYVEGIKNGNIALLSQSITLLESSNSKHQELSQKIIEKCLPFSGKSMRIGITGVPGVGKSTFIESLGAYIVSQRKKIAVLTIDPSSTISKGSILGDKTRMQKLSISPNAYIRPSPSSGLLGGVAKKTRESIILCEAAGYEIILIETVGVGQSETTVHSMVDIFLLLMLAGAGDELQGIKRGIMEMADIIAINKADSNNIKKSELAKIEYRNAIKLFPPSFSKWEPKVFTCSSLNNKNIDLIWQTILTYFDLTKKNHFFYKKRQNQASFWFYETINTNLKNVFYNHPKIKKELKKMAADVKENNINPFTAAKKLLDLSCKE